MSASLKTHLAMDARHQVQFAIDDPDSSYWELKVIEEKNLLARRFGRAMVNHLIVAISVATQKELSDRLHRVNEFILDHRIDAVYTVEQLVVASRWGLHLPVRG